MNIEPIAHIHTDMPDKFGIPRQSGIVPELMGSIEFEGEYAAKEAFRGLEEFSHIWVIWGFSENENKAWSPTVRPPRLGGNTRKGVYATRSPFRPNNLGLSLLKIENIDADKGIIKVSGIDMLDNSPVYDIKPYLPYVECRAEAVGGFADEMAGIKLDVIVPDEVAAMFTEEEISAIIGIIREDPRPAYQDDETRVYGFTYGKHNIRFTVQGNRAEIKDAE